MVKPKHRAYRPQANLAGMVSALLLPALVPAQSTDTPSRPDRTPTASRPTTTSPASEPTTRPASGEASWRALLTRIAAAHHPEGKRRMPTAFTARLTVSARPEGTDSNIDIQLDAQFVMPAFIRYAVEENNASLQRGRDEQGSWVLTEEGITDLDAGNARVNAQEKGALRQHIGLCRQLLRFLDPAAELAKLTDRNGPTETSHPVPMMRDQRCLKVSGTVDSFPMFHDEGRSHRARLDLWFDAETALLRALAVRPVASEGASGPRKRREGEFVLIEAPQLGRGGRMIPRAMRIFPIDPAVERIRPLDRPVRIEINRLELDPKALNVASLRRPG